MKQLLALFVSTLTSFGILISTPVMARSFATMHFENDLPRPSNVSISGARSDQVVLYCTQVSAGCKTLRAHLKAIQIDYLDKDPKTDSLAASEFDALGGQGVPLVVFRDRIMHGYYPSSFDRLYARYQAGSSQTITQAAVFPSPANEPSQPASTMALPTPSATERSSGKSDKGRLLSSKGLPTCVSTIIGSGSATRWVVQNNCGGNVEIGWCWSKSLPSWRNSDNVCAKTGVRSSGLIQDGASYEFSDRPHSQPDAKFPIAAMLSVSHVCLLDADGVCPKP